jgi:two-component system LytT family sensor kinase
LVRLAALMTSNYNKYWLFQAGGWGSFALINTFFALTFGKLNNEIVTRMFIFIILGVMVTHAMRWLIQRLDLLLKPLNQQIAGFILLTLFVAVLFAMVEIVVFKSLRIPTKEMNNSSSFFEQIFSFGYNAFFYLIIWNCIYFIYHYVEKSRKQQLDTLKLEALVKALELQTIKAHINPHFIFNSLNGIRALVVENPERARKSITELSNILRSSMQVEKVESVTLERELNIVKDYLALENMRFEDRLKIEYDIDEDTLDQQVPPMMLQTLVENAIKHGISKQINGGIVKVISDYKNNYHELTVQNTGKLNGNINKEGFGLSSTLNRLNILYGDKAKFEIKQLTPQTVEAKVQLPVTIH